MLFEILPVEQRAAAEAAVAATFPGQPVEAVAKVAAGLSGAGVYRLTVGGTAYLSRVETNRGGAWDPARQYACMRIAGALGVAPKAYHLDAEAGIAISAFIEATPMAQVDRAERLKAVARSLATLHAGPVAPAAPELFVALDGIWAMGAGVLPAAEVARFEARFRAVRAAYPAPTEPAVTCHHDMNPSNLLFADGRAWLVDWEVAGAGDRFVDLASVGHWFCAGEAEEMAFLTAYFGRPPAAAERERYGLALQALRLLQGMLFVALAAKAQPGYRIEDLETPPLAALRPRMGELMATPAGRAHFGLACLNEAWRATEGLVVH